MKNEIKSFLTLIIYSFSAYILLYIYPYLFGHVYDKTQPSNVIGINVTLDIFLFIVCILLNLDIFKRAKRITDENGKQTFESFIRALLTSILLFMAVKYVLGVVVTILSYIFNIKSSSINQEVLEILFKLAPVAMFITGAFIAPVTEELVFRGAIKRIIKNKKVFITVSGLIFGLVHICKYSLPIFVIIIAGYLIDMVVTSQMTKKHKIDLIVCTMIIMLTILGISMQTITGDLIEVLLSIELSELVNGIMYVGVGCYLAYIYYKYDNIYLNILVHVFNNLMAYIVLFTML